MLMRVVMEKNKLKKESLKLSNNMRSFYSKTPLR